jgi:exopolysaccharide production protein ExoQ
VRRAGGPLETGPLETAGGGIRLSLGLCAPATARRLAIGFGVGFDAIAVLFFPLLVLMPRGVAPLASAAGLFAAGLALSSNRVLLRPGLAVPAICAGALLVWGCVSALWSVDPLRSLDLAARLSGLFAAGLAMMVASDLVAVPRRLTSLLLAGFVFGIAMAGADLVTDGALSKPFSDRFYQPAWLNQASVACAILLLPAGAVLAVRGHRILALLFALAAAATICALAGTAAKVALAAGLSMALLCYWRRAQALRAAALLSVLVIVTAPLTFARLDRVSDLVETADSIKLSAGHRLLIWSFVGDRIAEHPLAGWGLDSSRAIPGGKDPIRAGETWLPLHPHNAALQLWLELGVPGVVLFALLIGGAWLALAAAEWPPLFAAAAAGSLATAFVATFGTYGMWQEWWQGTLWFSLFIVLVMGREASGGAGRT